MFMITMAKIFNVFAQLK